MAASPTDVLKRGRMEAAFARKGLIVAGVDEVGRGCLAGPVFAASVVLDFGRFRKLSKTTRHLIRDSKQLSETERQQAAIVIADHTLASAIASAGVREIEKLGIVPATFLAMRRALSRTHEDLSQSGVAPDGIDMTLVDGKHPIRGYPHPQTAVIKGDFYCYAIAAASIIAKNARDRYMREKSSTFDVWGFESHVGYGTSLHLDRIRTHGICTLHRRNFEPIRSLLAGLPQASQPSDPGVR